jgi:hypothetical protein
MAAGVLLPSSSLWRIQAALPEVMLAVDVPVLFLPSPAVLRIRTIQAEARRWQHGLPIAAFFCMQNS